MKAITLYQPWASLLASGAKRFETRSWATSYRGPIAIHAAKRPFNTGPYLDRELHPFAEALGLPDIYSFDLLPYGAIIATAELVGCWGMVRNPYDGVMHFLDETDAAVCIDGNELLFGDWTPGRYAWEFKNMTMLPEPIPAKGGQRIWNWEAT